MDSFVVIGVVVVCLPTALILALVWIPHFLRLRRFAVLASAFGTTAKAQKFECHRGRARLVASLEGQFDGPATLELVHQIATGATSWIELRPETWVDRFGKLVGLN